jgi:hypothetical protein
VADSSQAAVHRPAADIQRLKSLTLSCWLDRELWLGSAGLCHTRCCLPSICLVWTCLGKTSRSLRYLHSKWHHWRWYAAS